MRGNKHINIDPEKVGKRIFTIRTGGGLTMEEFGQLFDTSKGTVNNWEKGRNLPNKRNLKAIADFASIDVAELLLGVVNRERLLSEIKETLHELLDSELGFGEAVDRLTNLLKIQKGSR